MKKLAFTFVVISTFVACVPALAQKQGSVWYFPRNLGLNFNYNPPTLLRDGHLWDPETEGCASIASANGELLFYANADTIWNRKHELMRNGGGLMGQASSTNGAVIVPMPGENNKYYVFTTDAWQYGVPLKVGYSIVDMCGDNGYGEVLSNKKNIVLLDSATEKLAVTQHTNGVDYWLVTHKHFSNAFNAYLITENGISNAVVSNVGTIHGNIAYSNDLRGYQDLIGQMKISPDGRKLALVMENRAPDVIDLFDFDRSSGVVSGYKNLSDGTESFGVYGVAFSNDQSKLYVNGRFGLFQFSLEVGGGTEQGIKSSKQKIANTSYASGGLQLGPDEKIYVARGFYVGIIQNPNLPGAACNFVDNAIYLEGEFLGYAFPTFIDNFNYPEKEFVPFNVDLDDAASFCSPNSIDLREQTNGDNLTFLWADGSTNPVYHFSEPGQYGVTISNGSCVVQKEIFVTPPFDAIPEETKACEGDTIMLVSNVSNAVYHWGNGSTEESLPVNTAGTYFLTVTKNNCTIKDSIKVTYKPLPLFNLGEDTTLCEGGQLHLTIAAQADQYTWQDGQTNSVYIVTKPGKYKATAIYDGCSHSDEIVIGYSLRPRIDLGQDTILCSGSTLKLDLDPALAYHWNDGSDSNSKVVDQSGILWVNSVAGYCSSVDSIKVDFVNCELHVPNIFTPNQDSYNQHFIPFQMSGITSAWLTVYNRWGTKMYHTDNFSLLNGWDGTYHSDPVSSGIYFWEIKYIDIENNEHMIKGTVTVQR